MAKTMKRHEWWRHNYRQRRYLEHATGDELRQRLQDLMGNMGDFTAEGKLALKNPLKEGEWIELFTHLLEELALRGESITPEMLQGAHFDGRRFVSAKRAAEIWKGRELLLRTYLLKFGKLRYLRPLLNLGNIEDCPR